MKTRTFLLPLLMFVTVTSFAQQNLSFGPMLGGNASTLRGDVGSTKARPGLNAGLFINYSSDSRLGFKAELLYTGMGTYYNNSEQERNLTYLQLPVMGVLYLNEKGKAFRPKIFAGPYLSYLLSAKDHQGKDYNTVNEDFEKIDVGLKAGAGFNYRLNNKVWLNTELYVIGGIADISPDKNVRIRNQSLGLNVGLSFPLGTYQKSR